MVYPRGPALPLGVSFRPLLHEYWLPPEVHVPLKDKLWVPENRVGALIDHWDNARLMHPGRNKMQRDIEWGFAFPPGYYAILNCYCNDCAVCRATKS